MAYDLGAFAKIVNVQFGSAWLLLNLDIGGVKIDGAAPPYGVFAFTIPKGSHATKLDQTQVAKSQTNQITNNDLWFPWPDIEAAPNLGNYNTPLPDVGPPIPPTHLYSVVNGTGIFWPSDPTFPIPDNDFWYHAAKVASAVSFLNGVFDVVLPGASYAFTNLDGSHTLFPLPVHFSAQKVTVTTTQGATNYNIKALYSVPTTATDLQVTMAVPQDCVGIGWASIFTSQKKAISKVADITGTADQSVYFPGVSPGSKTALVTTTGVKNKGTVKIVGQVSQTPGLPFNAPPSPS